MFLTYILALAFLAIFGFTAIPVFLFFNMWNTCAAMKSPDANITSPDSICVDVRQYGNSDKRCTVVAQSAHMQTGTEECKFRKHVCCRLQCKNRLGGLNY